MVERLAIFDIDFTLTKKETLIEFYKFMFKKKLSLIRRLPGSLFAGLLYLMKIYDLKKAKSVFISFVDGIDESELQIYVKEFYEKVISKILYDDAIEMIKKLKQKGYRVILISASAEFYLREFYNIKEVDKVIGTIYEFGKGDIKGGILGENCKGEEKVKRLLKYIEEEKIEINYEESYMFSDSLSDAPLLELVGHPYLINYKGKCKEYNILNWQ